MNQFGTGCLDCALKLIVLQVNNKYSFLSLFQMLLTLISQKRCVKKKYANIFQHKTFRQFNGYFTVGTLPTLICIYIMRFLFVYYYKS